VATYEQLFKTYFALRYHKAADAVLQSIIRIFRLASGAVGNAVLLGFSVCATHLGGGGGRAVA
jgi:hypothetical protein